MFFQMTAFTGLLADIFCCYQICGREQNGNAKKTID
jgi:hypothetical protein